MNLGMILARSLLFYRNLQEGSAPRLETQITIVKRQCLPLVRRARRAPLSFDRFGRSLQLDTILVLRTKYSSFSVLEPKGVVPVIGERR